MPLSPPAVTARARDRAGRTPPRRRSCCRSRRTSVWCPGFGSRPNRRERAVAPCGERHRNARCGIAERLDRSPAKSAGSRLISPQGTCQRPKSRVKYAIGRLERSAASALGSYRAPAAHMTLLPARTSGAVSAFAQLARPRPSPAPAAPNRRSSGSSSRAAPRSARRAARGADRRLAARRTRASSDRDQLRKARLVAVERGGLQPVENPAAAAGQHLLRVQPAEILADRVHVFAGSAPARD